MLEQEKKISDLEEWNRNPASEEIRRGETDQLQSLIKVSILLCIIPLTSLPRTMRAECGCTSYQDALRSEILSKNRLRSLKDRHKTGVYFLFYVLRCFSWHLFQSFLLEARNAFSYHSSVHVASFSLWPITSEKALPSGFCYYYYYELFKHGNI